MNFVMIPFLVIGIALDGHLKDEDVNLASSTLVSEGKTTADAMGIVLSYSIRVKVNCGTLGGELATDVPFKLMHPAPGNYIKNLFFCNLMFLSLIVLNILYANSFKQITNSLITTGTVERERVNAIKKMKSIERHRYENSHYADDDDNIVFEDFARMRMNEPE